MYMVLKFGGNAPKKIHNDIESAIQEANRLAKQDIGRFYVLEVKHIYESKIYVTVEL